MLSATSRRQQLTNGRRAQTLYHGVFRKSTKCTFTEPLSPGAVSDGYNATDKANELLYVLGYDYLVISGLAQ